MQQLGMDNFILPASPNWQLSSVLACNDNGLIAYGSRSDVSIINFKPNGKFEVSILQFAHKDRLSTIVFSPVDGKFKNCLATCGDDGMVRLWNFEEGRLLYFHSGHKDGLKVVGLDWSRADTNRLVSVSDLGSIVCWDLRSNTIRRLHCGVKVLPLTLACCPHDQDLVGIGCKGGVTLIVDIKGTGKIVHRLRGLEHDVISISWCPVPYNVIKRKRNVDSKVEDTKEVKTAEVVESNTETEHRDLLLATGCVDKSIFIWRAGSDGRYEVILNLPNNSVNSNFPRKKGYPGSNNTMLWTCVHWVDAYTLLSTSQFGELLSWDLNKVYKDKNTKKLQPRLLHSRHYKGCFAIACPVIYDAVTNWEAETRTVWTTAMDKHVVGCSLGSGKIILDIPTMGGAVYAMALSPLDPNRLAIGSSDSKVFVWNMSNLTSLSIVSYWKKIIGKVMSLCWHPNEENWLAFGTGDGHVGLIDVSSNKTPTLFRLHHRNAVYRICWAPPVLKPDDADIDKTKLVLYSVGDGDIFQYTAKPEESNEEPKSLNTALLNSFDKSLGLHNSLIRSDIVFKPDSTCFAIGSENGSVYIVSCETLKLMHTVYPHKKLMNNLEWHPETVASDNNISPYKDWLAITCENIKVYDIPAEGQPVLVATLSGHSEKIVGLAWSPHFNGRLLSASYDHSVQIWDVPSQKCLGVYQGHSMAVMCALFNPLNPDMVISGSSDNTVRHWSISQLAQKPVVKPAKKKERQGALDKERADAEEATELIVGVSELAKREESNVSTSKQNIATNTSPTSKQPGSATDKSMEEYKKRLKGRAVFTVTGSNLIQARHFDVVYDRWEKTTNPVSTLDNDLTASTTETPSATDIGYLDFFEDDKAMRRLLMVEESRLTENKHYMLAQTSMLWRGDISQMIQEAIAKKKLSDWLVSMAPLAGFEVWEEACVAFAKQLEECGEVLKASSYLLAIHNVHEAVRLLADHKMFKEAVAVAKCRLSHDDSLTSKVYTEWGDMSRAQGNLTLAVHCYWAACNFQLCIETLVRIKELKYLKMAAVIAKFHNYTELANSLALECLLMSISASNPTVGYHILEQFPNEEYEHWTVWLKVSEVLSKVKNRGERDLFDWLEGRQKTQISLPDELTKVFSSLCEPREGCDRKYSPKKEEVEVDNPHDRTTEIMSFIYSRLHSHFPTNKNPEYERDLWFYLSGQLTGAFVGRLGCAPSRFLRHLVAAFSAAFHYQTHHPSSLALPILVSVISPAGIFAENSIFTMEYKTDKEIQLAKSLRAFVCASIVQWMSNNWEKVVELRSKREEKPAENGSGDGRQEVELYKMDWLPELITRCSSDVLDKENVSYFVKKALKEELQNTVTKENIQKKITMEKSVDCKTTKQNKIKNKTQTISELADDETNGNFSVESQTSKKDVAENKNESLNSAQNKGDSVIVVPKKEEKSTPFPKNQEQQNTAALKSNTAENAKEQELVQANKSLNECSEDAHKLLQKTGKETNPATSIVQNGDTTTVHSAQNGEAITTNGTDSHGVSDENIELKLKEIKEIDEVIHKFETTRVTVPSPFTAYMNIKYLIDNLVTKQDSKLAQILQGNCDKIWKKSHD